MHTGSPPFELFGAAHLAALVLGVLAGVLLVAAGVRMRGTPVDRTIRLGLAVTLWGAEAVRQIDLVVQGDWALSTSLPINVCPAAAVALPVLLLTRDRRLFDVLFFWGLLGAAQALLTPDLVEGWPTLRFVRFMVTHAAIPIAVAWVAVVDRMRPTWGSVWRVWWFTQVWMVLAAAVDLATGGNYLFLAHKPQGATVIDFLGPWPVYLVALEALGLGLVMGAYAPFALWDRWRR